MRLSRAELKRAKLVGAARDSFREQGVEQSTIAAIAERAQVPAGGVFYHFRSKEILIDAVIEDHLLTFTKLLTNIEIQTNDPRARLELFLDVTDGMSEDRARLGCPIAKLVQDVRKPGYARDIDPADVFVAVLAWLERQFSGMGLAKEQIRPAGLHVFSALQGAFLLAFALNDPAIVNNEVSTLRSWLKGIGKS